MSPAAFGLDIVARGIDPGRTSYHLKSLDRVRPLDEQRQGSVLRSQPPAHVEANIHRVVGGFAPARGISFDRRRLKGGMRAGLAEQSVCRGHQQDSDCEDARS